MTQCYNPAEVNPQQQKQTTNNDDDNNNTEKSRTSQTILISPLLITLPNNLHTHITELTHRHVQFNA